MRDSWMRWLWVPIVVPGFVLAWLAWRAVSVEQTLLHQQVAESRQRLADQVAGSLSGGGKEFLVHSQVELERWVLDVGMGVTQVPPPWFDAVEIRNQDDSSRPMTDPADSTRLELLYQSLWEGPMDADLRLSRLEDWLLVILHAPDNALPGDLERRLEKIRKGVSADLAIRPHWRPLLTDQTTALERRAIQVRIRREAGLVFDSLSRNPRTHLVTVAGHVWLVMAPPDLPRGVVAVGRFSESELRQRLISTDFVSRRPGETGVAGLVLGWKDGSGQVFGIEGSVPAREPDLVVPVPGGFPNWSVAVWSTAIHEKAARFRSVLVSALLGMSLVVLVGATAAASRSFRVQRALLSMKTDFISNVSHELKTPLTSIAIYAELLASGRAGERSGEFGSTILREAKRLQGLIEGLLSFARDEAVSTVLHKERLAFDQLVKEVGESFHAVSQRRGIELAVESVPVWIEADRGLLRPVLDNLLDNAFKYGRQGGFVHLSLVREGDWAVLRVRDNGPGIPEEEQPRVFERFYRGGGDLTRTVSGTGLGLAIVRRNVEFHGGEVELKSQEGSGTTFEIRLPAVEDGNA